MERYLKKKQIRKEFPTFFYYQKTRGFDLFSTFKKSAANFFRQIVLKAIITSFGSLRLIRSLMLSKYDDFCLKYMYTYVIRTPQVPKIIRPPYS